MRTVSNLLNLDGMIYVYLASPNLSALLMKNAEAEGFTFGDGVKLTERGVADIMALKSDWTINYVGWAGHMAFRYSDDVVGDPIIRVDYGKYISGSDNYIIEDALIG